jgi:hypothetical protein
MRLSGGNGEEEDDDVNVDYVDDSGTGRRGS